jgi:hypothetical protein
MIDFTLDPELSNESSNMIDQPIACRDDRSLFQGLIRQMGQTRCFRHKTDKYIRVAAKLTWTAVGSNVLPNVSNINSSIVRTVLSPGVGSEGARRG